MYYIWAPDSWKLSSLSRSTLEVSEGPGWGTDSPPHKLPNEVLALLPQGLSGLSYGPLLVDLFDSGRVCSVGPYLVYDYDM